MTRFIHTSDWHLGMRARFLPEDARARFLQSRFDAVRRIAQLAKEERAEFVVVAGDVFDHNLVDRRVVSMALEALRTFTVPVFLLPGNHDPLDPGSVYRSERWLAEAPGHVTVLTDAEPRSVAGVEVVGVPWLNKHPLSDPVAGAVLTEPERPRVVVGHGALDVMSPAEGALGLVAHADLQAALDAGRAGYVALGDRHSATELHGMGGRAWYSGSPVATDFDQVDPNQVLVVELTGEGLDVSKRTVGEWCFLREQRDLAGDEDLSALARWLDARESKHTTALRLELVGTLTLAQGAELDALLDRYSDTFASLNRWERHSDLTVSPGSGDLEDLELSGYARAALEELQSQALAGGDDGASAGDALNLLYRLAR
ncbi:MAG: exonuclease SbcCD subunit D [Solirubrobacterales bacterium]|nr:exonuclease SbcCD subunit D [Solirubrobacterales bacterium]